MKVKRRMVVFGRAVIPMAVLLAGSGLTMAASEVPEIGEAELVVSLVRGRLGQSTRELAIKDNVFIEEVIETDADAAARIVFLDGTELSLGPSSLMVLDRYVYDPNTGAGEMAMRMVPGVFEFASGDIPSADDDLGTPFGNLAVRGTRCAFSLENARMVVECMGENPEEGVAIGGQSVSAGGACLAVLARGQGAPRFLEGDECEAELAGARQMAAMLGDLRAVEPAAGPVDFSDPSGGIGGDSDDDPTGSGEVGVSAQ
jgi:hypothetical protein